MHWICASRWAVAAAVGIAAAMAAIVAQAQGQPAREDAYFDLRRGLDNCRLAFLNNHAGRVGFIGGSITVATGWRDHTCAALQAAFPDTRFDFINAGIGGTNSTLGAFRLEDDVFRNGPVDLLFIEFAVNDGGDCPDNRRVRAMEGMVRRAHRLNPAIDIVIQYFVDQSKYGDLSKGRVPETITAHEQVAKHYDITVIDLAREVTRRLDAGAFDWDTFARDSCHPTAFGHEVYGECIRAVLDAAWAEPPAPGAQPAPRPLPEPLDPMNYENGRFIPLEKGRIIDGWQRLPAWTAEKTCNYTGPVDVLAAEQPGATLELEFEGRLVGINAIAGMDAGMLECAVDGGEPFTVDLFDQYCERFHRPVCRVLAEDLPAGPHVIRLRIAESADERSTGHATRILRFVVN